MHLLNPQVNSNQFVVQYITGSGITFGLLSLLVGRYVPTKVIHVHNWQKPWFDDKCRVAFGLKQQAHLRGSVIALWLTGKSFYAVKRER